MTTTWRSRYGRRAVRLGVASLVASGLATVIGVSPAFAALGPANGSVLRGVVTLTESAPGGGTSGGCGGAHTSITVFNAAGQVVANWSNNGGSLSVSWTTETVPNGGYTISSSWNKTFRQWWGSCATGSGGSDTSHVTVDNVATLAYSGPTAAPWGTTINALASLVDPNLANSPLAGQGVTFTLYGEQPVTSTTNASGVASAQISLNSPARAATMQVSFGGSPYYEPTSTSVGFTVQGHPTRLAYTGPTSGTWGKPSTLSATLTDTVTGIRIAGDPVTFTLGSQSVSGVTNASGVATTTLTPDQTPGNYTLAVSFSGDADYAASATGAPFRIHWQYSFVDAKGNGTVKVNPGTNQFLFEAPSSSPTQSFGPITDPSMTVVALPTGNHAIDITYTSPALVLKGDFVEESGQFAAAVDSASNVYVLSDTGAAL